MLATYYHATPYENLESILENGIKRGVDGVVYLTEGRDETMRFLLIRGYRDILTVEVLIDSENVDASMRCLTTIQISLSVEHLVIKVTLSQMS